jgi:hypothetical protein
MIDTPLGESQALRSRAAHGDKLHRVTVIEICGVTVRRSAGRGEFWRAEGPR